MTTQLGRYNFENFSLNVLKTIEVSQGCWSTALLAASFAGLTLFFTDYSPLAQMLIYGSQCVEVVYGDARATSI